VPAYAPRTRRTTLLLYAPWRDILPITKAKGFVSGKRRFNPALFGKDLAKFLNQNHQFLNQKLDALLHYPIRPFRRTGATFSRVIDWIAFSSGERTQ